MKLLRRNKKADPAGQACCVNHHRTDRFDDSARRMARDQVAPVTGLRYR